MKREWTTKIQAGLRPGYSYLDCLKRLAPEVAEGTSTQNPHVVPYILTCAAALEALLNDAIISHVYTKFGVTEYKRVAVAYMGMSLRGKLDAIVPLVTNNRFLLNHECSEYQALASMITVRNSLLHGKEFLEEYELTLRWDDEPYLVERARIEPDKTLIESVKNTAFCACDATQCQKYLSALDTFTVEIVKKEENLAPTCRLLKPATPA